MTQTGEPIVPDPLRSAIQTQHPTIAGEIEGAIQTLRKLQEIAGPAEAARPPGPGGAASQTSALATTDGAPAAGGAAPASPAQIGAARSEGRPPPTLAAGETFGRYQIVRQLGKGAMGAVYLAYDSQLHRHVALKTPLLGGSKQTIDRFFVEARAAAQIRSPYICPIHDVGLIGAVYYLSMAYIDGRPLSRAVAERRLGDARAAALLTQKIARGMQKAHEQGIIHRDLKPDNIMIDGDGEPVVMDFGLARRVDDDIRLTAPGRILGTLAYMSPEQVEGDPKAIGPASDVYSLGVVFYELLTGRLPFEGTFTAVLRKVALDEPPRPSAVNPSLGVNSPAERVCLWMMAKSPADRCPGMGAVAAALDEAFPRERPADVAKPSRWKPLLSWAAGLFTRRVSARPSAGAPAGSSRERTLAGSGSGPTDKKDQQSQDQTVDVPRSSVS